MLNKSDNIKYYNVKYPVSKTNFSLSIIGFIGHNSIPKASLNLQTNQITNFKIIKIFQCHYLSFDQIYYFEVKLNELNLAYICDSSK